jgi:hypothetical protein
MITRSGEPVRELVSLEVARAGIGEMDHPVQMSFPSALLSVHL